MKNKRKTLLSLILILVLSVSMSVTAFAAVRMSKTRFTTAIGIHTTLRVTGTTRTPRWSSSNTRVARVTQRGVVGGRKSGTSVIKATVGGRTVRCRVTVLNYKQIANRLEKKVRKKYKYASVNGVTSYSRHGIYLDLEVSKPQGDGAPWILYTVNLKTGVAVCQDEWGRKYYFPKLAKKYKLY